MVDDGLRFCHAESKCDTFRVAFEKTIEQEAKDKDKEVRSSVALLIGGDLTSLLAVERRLTADIPVVICAGTGGLADVLAFFKRNGLEKETRSTSFTERLKRRLLMQLRDLQVPEPNLEETVSRVVKIVSSENMQASIDLAGGAIVAGWGSPTALELAAKAECKTFTSSRPAQQAIAYLWSGGINCNLLVYYLVMLCPPLLLFPRILHFSENYAFGLDHRDCQRSTRHPETFSERLQRFYGCPRTKFSWSFLICLLFLVICSATLLLPLQPESIGRLEIAFMVLIALRLVGSILSVRTQDKISVAV
ncbi:hypothetical protein AAHC03_04640 [Spirometra sp. Aus1]